MEALEFVECFIEATLYGRFVTTWRRVGNDVELEEEVSIPSVPELLNLETLE